MGRVKAGSLGLGEAAELLELSYRQSKRIWARYRAGGAQALQHGNCGRVSNRAYGAKFRARVLQQVQARYGDFGPTLAAEHLASDDGLEVQAETLRRWMKQAGLWRRQRRRKPYRQRRERKAHFGELVQLDGSFHEWLEEREERGCLMHMVDDATTTVLAGFSQEETTWAAARVLRSWMERYGVPRALYTDWKNVYKRKATPAEQLRGKVPLSQFGRMCQKLGIRIIAASSPQAKGRVERNHGIHQDRMIKKLRRKGIASYGAANQFLEKEYLPQHNRRFARVPAKPEDYHGRKPTARELRQIFRVETERRISNDWVLRHEGRYLQLQPAGQRRYGPTQSKALVCEWEDGAMEVYYRGQRLAYRELAEPLPRKCEVDDRTKHSVAVPWFAKPRKPSQDHPWRRDYRDMKPSWSRKVEIPPRTVAGTEAAL